MKGAKFVVLSLRDIIKNLIFIVVGITLLVVLFLVFFKESSSTANVEYIPGTYSSQIFLKGEPLAVYVTIDSDGIADINTSALAEKQVAYYPLLESAFEDLKPQVLEAQSTEIPLSADAYYTEYVLLNAIDDALNQAVSNQ